MNIKIKGNETTRNELKKIVQNNNVLHSYLFLGKEGIGKKEIAKEIEKKKRRIPVIAHESDIEAGLANKLIASRCKKMLTAFPSTASKFKNGKYVGTPMRTNLFGRDKEKAKAYFNLDNRPTVLVFGGGSGSKIINENIRKIAFELCKKINLLHLCGRGNAVETNIYGYKQLEFADDMGIIYACADGAVARCGSNSANELIALKIPALFIPLENSSSRGDQLKNAEFFQNAGLCHTIREKDLSPEGLKKEIVSILEDQNLKTALDNSKIECGNNAILKEIKLILR